MSFAELYEVDNLNDSIEILSRFVSSECLQSNLSWELDKCRVISDADLFSKRSSIVYFFYDSVDCLSKDLIQSCHKVPELFSHNLDKLFCLISRSFFCNPKIESLIANDIGEIFVICDLFLDRNLLVAKRAGSARKCRALVLHFKQQLPEPCLVQVEPSQQTLTSSSWFGVPNVRRYVRRFSRR